MSTRSIYIVDDDDDVRTSLQTLLSTLSNTLIWTFRSGDAFLERVAELEPGCVLLDFHMPGSTGLDVLKALAAEKEKFASIVLTGHGDVSVAVQAMKAGALDFLEKPYDYATLLATVEQTFTRLEHSHAEAALVADAQAKVGQLSSRERDVLDGLIEGRSNKIIAFDLAISPRTVEIYRANLMEKLGVKSLPDVLRVAFTAGLLPDSTPA